MKINRSKRAQATLTFYKNNFGFHPPYKILIDRTFCKLSLKLGFDLNAQIIKYLQSDVILYTTRCVIQEMEKIGEPVKDALKIVKTLRLAKCAHSELETRPSKCFLSIVNHESNAEHFFIATQDVKLLKKLGDKVACPFICIKLNALFLNKPTQASKDKSKKDLDDALVTSYELAKLKEIKKIEIGDEDNLNKKKRKKLKGPHPLSCKKKQIKLNPDNVASTSGKKKRKQKKNKISKHIRKILKRNNEENCKN